MIRDFLFLIFPEYCHGCYQPLVKGEKHLCIKCISQLPKTHFHLVKESPLSSKLSNLNKLHHAMSYVKFVKGGTIQKLMHKIKYENKPEIAEMLGYWYGIDLVSAGMDKIFNFILPVPLHVVKLRKRGYNQSAYFAAGLSRALHIPYSDKILVRIKKSETQTRKSKVERWRNVEGIFQIIDPNIIQDKHILIVDDVLTTGSTIEACAVALEPHCAAVSVATLAVAQ